MTQEELHYKFGELHGFENIQKDFVWIDTLYGTKNGDEDYLPNYDSLDGLAELEKHLCKTVPLFEEDYYDELAVICVDDWLNKKSWTPRMVFAIPAQRQRAIIKVLKLL